MVSGIVFGYQDCLSKPLWKTFLDFFEDEVKHIVVEVGHMVYNIQVRPHKRISRDVNFELFGKITVLGQNFEIGFRKSPNIYAGYDH